MRVKFFFIYLFLCIFFFCVIFSCTQKLDEKTVKTTLLNYGKENTENIVRIQTKYGVIVCSLYVDTPLHRANFVRLIKNGYYKDNTEFYRVIHRFMIQGGDLGKLVAKEEKVMIPAEFNPKYFHKRGALAMARPDENNPEKKSSPTEFYIIQGTKYDSLELQWAAKQYNLQVTPLQFQTYTTIGGDITLDMRYTVFGEVIEGLEIIDKIAIVETYSNDKPIKKIPFTIDL
jgi:cyclophilin family peptidyl-prolyl cis-trans isomerase